MPIRTLRLCSLLVVLAQGCAHTSETSSSQANAEHTALQYGRALANGDAPASWTLLTPTLREGRSSEEQAEIFRANTSELQEAGNAIVQGVDTVTTRARLELQNGEVIILLLEENEWRIEGGILNAAGLGSPTDTIAAFRRALMRRDLRGIERVLSHQTRAEWEEEARRLIESTADPDALQIEMEGNRARIQTLGAGVIELIRESGEWRIVDVHGP